MSGCIRAQEVLSATHDGEVVDVASLAEARTHVASCSECSRFSRLLAAERTSRPKAPSGLVQSVIAAVRREQAAKERKAATERPRTVETAPGHGPAGDGGERIPQPVRRGGWEPSEPASPRRLTRHIGVVARSLAAAAVVVGFGLLTTYGISLMTAYSGDTALSARETASAPYGAAGEGERSDARKGLAPEADDSARRDRLPSLISVDGDVYRLTGSVETSGALTRVGATRSSLDDGGQRLREVYAGQAGVVLAEGSSWLSFSRVVHSFEGRPFGLRSGGDIESFTEWPTLPRPMLQPSSEDGSPIFEPYGTDPVVHVRVGSDPSAGIALPPGAPLGAGLGPAPVWTWWEPLTGD